MCDRSRPFKARQKAKKAAPGVGEHHPKLLQQHHPVMPPGNPVSSGLTKARLVLERAFLWFNPRGRRLASCRRGPRPCRTPGSLSSDLAQISSSKTQLLPTKATMLHNIKSLQGKMCPWSMTLAAARPRLTRPAQPPTTLPLRPRSRPGQSPWSWSSLQTSLLRTRVQRKTNTLHHRMLVQGAPPPPNATVPDIDLDSNFLPTLADVNATLTFRVKNSKANICDAKSAAIARLYPSDKIRARKNFREARFIRKFVIHLNVHVDAFAKEKAITIDQLANYLESQKEQLDAMGDCAKVWRHHVKTIAMSSPNDPTKDAVYKAMHEANVRAGRIS